MKSKILFIAATLGVALAGCSDIAEDDRFIPVEAAKVERTVLLEDFTGQGCVNCPAAHRSIEALEEQYGEHLIAVSIHAGNFGVPATNTRYTGLMQEEGQAYNDRYHIEEYPSGVINGSLPALNADLWATAVREAVQVTTPVSIQIEAISVNSGSEIAIDYKVESTEKLSGNLVVWIIESGIVARQEDKDLGRINDYVHNNVFRACVNGLDGDAVTLAPGTDATGSYNMAVKNTATEKWNIDNLAVVAFVTDGNGVLQAAKASVKPQE